MTKLSAHSGLGSELKKLRRERLITQAELAARAGIALKTVRLLETTRGTLATWNAALAALGLEVIGRTLPAAETLGQSIAALRRSRGFSQRALAELAEV